MSIKTHESCAELGVCQARKVACNGCDWRLAPGAIRGPFKRTRFVWVRRNWRLCILVLFVLLAWVSITAVAAFGLGYWGPTRG